MVRCRYIANAIITSH